MLKFEKELNEIGAMLYAKDRETRHLGYNLLRTSKFKKHMWGKLWSENGKSFYRFRLSALTVKSKDPKNWCYVNYYNENKIQFANKVICLYLQNRLIIRELK